MAVSVGNHLTRKKQHFPYEIAILCYGSPDLIGQRTLALLHAYHIPPQRITIFVQSKSDEQQLSQRVQRHRYGRLIVGETGHQAMETLVHRHYVPGTLLVVFDDSCYECIDISTPSGSLKSILSLIRTGFEVCKTANSGFWGVYPVAEQSFLRQTISSKLCYTSPAIWGCIVIPIQFTTEQYTHVERILSYYHIYSTIVRFNHITVRHTSHRKENIIEAVQLYHKYPKWTSVHSDSSGVHLRLHDSERNSKNHL